MHKGIQVGMSMIPNMGSERSTGGGMATSAPVSPPKNDNEGKPKKKLSPEELDKFGMFADSTDTKEIARYLMRKGLIGGEQLYTDHPDISSKEGIVNAQSDWKPAAISKMLIRARSLGLKTPTEIKANRAALLGSLDDRVKDAINHPAFTQIHSNFWETFDSILKDQYDKENVVAVDNTLASK